MDSIPFINYCVFISFDLHLTFFCTSFALFTHTHTHTPTTIKFIPSFIWIFVLVELKWKFEIFSLFVYFTWTEIEWNYELNSDLKMLCYGQRFGQENFWQKNGFFLYLFIAQPLGKLDKQIFFQTRLAWPC